MDSRKMFLATSILILSSLFLLALSSAAEEKEGITLTVYNQNIALVREVRALNLKEGISTIRYTDVASRIDPASVHIESLTHPGGFSVLEQNFEYDLASTECLLRKYLDRKISLLTKEGKFYEGTLLSFDSKEVILSKNASSGPLFAIARNMVQEIQFPELPEGLVTKPTLVWLLSVAKPGRQLTKLTYLTDDVNWKADYLMIVAPDDKAASLSGWVTIENRSGATYKDAKLKLVAGEIHRVKPPAPPQLKEMALGAGRAMAPQFVEKPFFEYHIYALERPTTIKENEKKQIQLLQAEDVPTKKVLTYNGARDGKKVRVNMEFTNRKESNLGIPLPKGKVRVYKADVDKSLTFLGEDEIEHTPKNEKVRIFIGYAFDIVGERKQMKAERKDRYVQDLSYEIKLRNRKKTPVEVVVEENMPRWVDWEIIEKSHPFEKRSQELIKFKVGLEPGKEKVITYTVRYRYR